MKTHQLIILLFLCTLAEAVCYPAFSAKTPLEQGWSRYQGWNIRDFDLEGCPDELQNSIHKGLALAGKGRLLRSRVYPVFSYRQLRDDLARTRLFLAREGYPGAQIYPVAQPDAGNRRLKIRFQIDPGPMVSVASVELVGWPETLPPVSFQDNSGLLTGQRFSDRKLEFTRLKLREILRESGFALAKVTAQIRPLNANSVDAVLTIVPQDHFQITEVTVTGCSPNLEPVTSRVLDISTPQPYSPSFLAERSFNLRSTQLFSEVSLETTPTGPGAMHLEATVKDARMRWWEASLGTWSDNPWMVRAGWTHRNIFKAGRGVDVKGSLATHSQSLGGGVTWQGRISPRARTRLGTEWVREDEDAYLSRELSLDLVQSFRPGKNGLTNMGISYSWVSMTNHVITDAILDDSREQLLEFWIYRKWDWTDNPLYPRQGGFLKIVGTCSPPISLSNSPYYQVQSDASGYLPLGQKAVLAGRLRTGYSQPLGDADTILSNRRFYAGGYSTMRGFGRRQLGPQDKDGIAGGGDLVLLAGVELRVPLVWILDLSVFLDSGQVWWKPENVRLDDLKTAAGFDLDIRTPLGPVRLGYAWNLTDTYPGGPTSLAHLGVGYPW